jgi:hypothetical protein
MTDANAFTKFVPGFDFLQGLVKNAGAALPAMGQWVAPTLDPKELEKRIEELKAIQFWLEQNARLLGATIQALEVQRMTLSTLKTMNVQMDHLRESMKISLPETAPPAPAPAPEPAAAIEAAEAPAAESAPLAPGAVDPMQWWGALTRQFTELATTALKDSGQVARELTTAGGDNAAPAPAARKKSAAKRPAARKSPARKSAAKRTP